MKHKFEISKEERQEDMIMSIKTYFYGEREEEIGGLAASLILDFILYIKIKKGYNKICYIL